MNGNETMNGNENENYAATGPETGVRQGGYRPELAIYHANARGTGSAMRMNLLPAESDRDGCVMLTLANQKTVGDRRAATPVFPTFDWENRVTVKLDFTDICRILQVFRGECESLGGDKGLYHRTSSAATKILLRHSIEPNPGYLLEVYRNAVAGDASDRAARILLSNDEALGIALAFENSIGLICFGVPRSDAAPARREAARGRDVRAA